MARKHAAPVTPDTAAPPADAGLRTDAGAVDLGSSPVPANVFPPPAVLPPVAPVAPAAAAKAPAPCAHTWERGRLADGSQVYRCAACDLTRAR